MEYEIIVQYSAHLQEPLSINTASNTWLNLSFQYQPRQRTMRISNQNMSLDKDTIRDIIRTIMHSQTLQSELRNLNTTRGMDREMN